MITGLQRSEGNIGLKTEGIRAGFTVLSICGPAHPPEITDGIGSNLLVVNTRTPLPAVHECNYQLLIYRLDGALSVTFVTDCVSRDEACQKADLIENLGYRVEVWRDGTRIEPQKRH